MSRIEKGFECFFATVGVRRRKGEGKHHSCSLCDRSLLRWSDEGPGIYETSCWRWRSNYAKLIRNLDGWPGCCSTADPFQASKATVHHFTPGQDSRLKKLKPKLALAVSELVLLADNQEKVLENLGDEANLIGHIESSPAHETEIKSRSADYPSWA